MQCEMSEVTLIWFQNYMWGKRRACPVNIQSFVSGFLFFVCFSYLGPYLTELSITRGSDNLGKLEELGDARCYDEKQEMERGLP